MKKTLIILCCFLAACGTQELSFAPETQSINTSEFTFKPGDEMYSACIPSELYFDNSFIRPDSICVRGEKKMYYYKGKYILTLCK